MVSHRWEIKFNTSLTEAYLHHEEEGEKISIFNRFKKFDLASICESTEWAIPMSEWPKCMQPKAEDDTAVAVGPKRKKPRGSGHAQVPNNDE